MGKGKNILKRNVAISSGMEQVDSACDSLISMLTVIQQYVNEVMVSISIPFENRSDF